MKSSNGGESDEEGGGTVVSCKMKIEKKNKGRICSSVELTRRILGCFQQSFSFIYLFISARRLFSLSPHNAEGSCKQVSQVPQED